MDAQQDYLSKKDYNWLSLDVSFILFSGKKKLLDFNNEDLHPQAEL